MTANSIAPGVVARIIAAAAKERDDKARGKFEVKRRSEVREARLRSHPTGGPQPKTPSSQGSVNQTHFRKSGKLSALLPVKKCAEYLL